MPRPSWDDVWLGIAVQMSQRSLCDGAQIGAVIVDSHNRPIASGYNGPPSTMDVPAGSSCQDWCPRRMTGERTLADYGNCVTIHAEANALLFADRRDFAGGTVYVTSAMCWDCGKLVANSGLSRVAMLVSDSRDGHRNPQRTIDFLRSCGLEVIIYPED